MAINTQKVIVGGIAAGVEFLIGANIAGYLYAEE